MATKRFEEPEQTVTQRVAASVTVRTRLLVLLGVVALIVGLAPDPYASIGAAALVAVAFLAGRIR